MRSRSESSSRSSLRTSTNRDRVQCFKCREYDHFANECPNLVPKDSDRESFPISEQGFVTGRILSGEECQILLDMGASKSYMSKSYYLRCKALLDLPKFASKTQKIHVGNGQYVEVLFVILVIIEICGHRLEVFTLVLEIFDNVDMVLGIKNLFELEGVIDS